MLLTIPNKSIGQPHKGSAWPFHPDFLSQVFWYPIHRFVQSCIYIFMPIILILYARKPFIFSSPGSPFMVSQCPVTFRSVDNLSNGWHLPSVSKLSSMLTKQVVQPAFLLSRIHYSFGGGFTALPGIPGQFSLSWRSAIRQVSFCPTGKINKILKIGKYALLQWCSFMW